MCDSKRRAVCLSGRSSRARSAGATQSDTLGSAATAIGAMANRVPSASAPVTKTEQMLCRILRSATPIGAATSRIYNELRPSKFTADLKARKRGRRKKKASRPQWNSSASNTLLKFNPAPAPARADVRNSRPSREFLGKLIFHDAAPIGAAGSGRNAHGLD